MRLSSPVTERLAASCERLERLDKHLSTQHLSNPGGSIRYFEPPPRVPVYPRLQLGLAYSRGVPIYYIDVMLFQKLM
jgi:hypothetical protein